MVMRTHDWSVYLTLNCQIINRGKHNDLHEIKSNLRDLNAKLLNLRDQNCILIYK